MNAILHIADLNVATYLERDVRMLRNVGDLRTFDAFVRMIAARTATTLDMTDIARSLGSRAAARWICSCATRAASSPSRRS